MKDKVGNTLTVGSLVLVAHNGPYLNFGRILSVPTQPRIGVIVVEAFQKENNPALPFELRPQSINSPHRIIEVDAAQVPPKVLRLLTQQEVFTETGARKEQNTGATSTHE